MCFCFCHVEPWGYHRPHTTYSWTTWPELRRATWVGSPWVRFFTSVCGCGFLAILPSPPRGPHRQKTPTSWNMGLGRFMLVFLLSLVLRTVIFPLSGFYCSVGYWSPEGPPTFGCCGGGGGLGLHPSHGILDPTLKLNPKSGSPSTVEHTQGLQCSSFLVMIYDLFSA